MKNDFFFVLKSRTTLLQNVGVVDSHFAELESQEFWCS